MNRPSGQGSVTGAETFRQRRHLRLDVLTSDRADLTKHDTKGGNHQTAPRPGLDSEANHHLSAVHRRIPPR